LETVGLVDDEQLKTCMTTLMARDPATVLASDKMGQHCVDACAGYKEPTENPKTATSTGYQINPVISAALLFGLTFGTALGLQMGGVA
jgi:hypothetical protein